MDPVKYSIVIPLYNEEGILPVLVERLQEIMAQLDGPAEVVMVDDGSRDPRTRSPRRPPPRTRGSS